MSFFIRNKKPSLNNNNRLQSKKRKFSEKPKISKKSKKADEEELTSEEEDDEGIGFDSNDVEDQEDVEEDLTEQERKVLLAKKYLEEIEQIQREKLNDSKGVLKTLERDVLEQEGRLKINVSDKLEKAELICTKFSGKSHRQSITCVVASSDSQHIYSASKEGIIIKWSIENKNKILSSPYVKSDKKSYHPILALAISNNNEIVASGDSQGNIKLWNNKLEFIHTFLGHKSGITGLTINFECDTLYSSSNDRSIKVWNLEDKAYVETLFGHQSSITSLDVLSKNKIVSSGGSDKSVRVWKIQEESQLVFNGHSRSIDMVKRLNDQQFVSCGDDGTLSLWSILKKVPTHTVSVAHDYDKSSSEPNWITSLACLPNSDLIASGSYDGFVKLWKVTPKRTLEFLIDVPLCGVINSLVFTNNQKHLIVGVGTEHRFGRWKTIKEAKNTVAIIDILIKK